MLCPEICPVADRVRATTPSGVWEGGGSPLLGGERPACWPAAQRFGAAKPLNELARTERASEASERVRSKT